MYTRQTIHSLTAVLVAIAVLALISAITLLSPTIVQAKPPPHTPNSVNFPTPEAGPAVVTPTPRAHR